MAVVASGDFILAEDVADIDTFHNFSVVAPFSNRAGLPSQYTKIMLNGVQCVWIYVVVTGNPGGNGITICTLPSGYHPASIQDYVCSGEGSSNTLTPVIEISTGGVIALYDCASVNTNWHLGWQLVKGPLS